MFIINYLVNLWKTPLPKVIDVPSTKNNIRLGKNMVKSKNYNKNLDWANINLGKSILCGKHNNRNPDESIADKFVGFLDNINNKNHKAMNNDSKLYSKHNDGD